MSTGDGRDGSASRGNGGTASPARGRGGRSGRGRGGGRGRGRNTNNDRTTNDDSGRGDGDASSNAAIGNRSPGGGRNSGAAGGGGGRRRIFSARGGNVGRGGNFAGGRNGNLNSSNVAAAAVAVAPVVASATEVDSSSSSAGVADSAEVPNVNVNEDAFKTDEEVLITFGPFVRSGNPNAFKIHQEYLVHTNQREFINTARQFLIEQQRNPPVVEKTVPTSVAQTAGRNDNGTLNDNSVGRTVNGGNSTHGNNVLPLQNDAPALNAINGSTPKPVLAPPPLPPPPGLHAPSQYAKTDVTQGSMHPMSAGEHRNIAPARAPPGMGQPLPAATPGPPNLSPNLHHGPPPGIPPHLQTPPSETNNNAEMPNAKKDTPSILPAALTTPAKGSKPAPAATPSKPLRVRRTQTRLEEQPGRLFANEIPAAAPGSTASFNNHPPTLSVRPRSELTARWVLPLTYLRDRALRRFEEERATSQAGRSPQNLTIRDALKYLAVGLFRRGASDNGAQSSIVSKEILGPDSGEDENGRPAKDYPFGIDQRTDSVFGTVPFYAPRTPGNVVFRLYFEDEAHVTLATGPCVSIIPAESDYDQVLRFILSNFKSKKGTVGVSSMHSLASVLELFSPARSDGQYARNYFDSAGRVAWGCVCESRKVVELAALTYAKKKKQLEEQKEIEENNEKMLQLELARSDSTENESSDTNGGGQDKTASNDSKSKYAMEEHTNERKWKEIQLAYAHVLKAAVSNDANQLLLKRDLLSKIRLEYELYCPLCEAFASNPFARSDDEVSKMPGDVSAFPHPVGTQHVQLCVESRRKMQLQVLGFVPKFDSIPSLISKSKKWGKKPIVTLDFFEDLTSAIDNLYNDEYAVSEEVFRRREHVRASIEHILGDSGAFPVGTRVAVFGSSANGFGSPNSDLDLCLQVPPSATNFSKDENGVDAMAKLATKFTEAGIVDVNTDRLTARIPIVKFNFPYSRNGETILVECDLSLQNPLACLNTSLLHAYSKIFPSTCTLASIIKRWAKARDINEPSKHTLSSYGYVLMLLYYLTSSESTGDGGVITPEGGNNSNPILPNLQWMDPTWAQNPVGPYREIPAKPKNQFCGSHPTESNYLVNSYFYRSGLESVTQFCSHSSRNLPSHGMLLASFFYYFAYEFDYKKNVVSLNAKHSNPIMEKEIKAEEDGWSLFRQGLSIEDPFELFYDVAHVLKASNFQLIRREFALAYTKIINAATSNKKVNTGKNLLDSICEPVSDNLGSI